MKEVDGKVVRGTLASTRTSTSDSSAGRFRLEPSAAVLTVTCIDVMSLAAAARTCEGYQALTCGLRELHGDDARRYRDYCVAGNHQGGSHELSENGFRRDVSI